MEGTDVSSCTGESGRRLRSEIERKIEKWQEPPPAKPEKPLAAPDDKPRKRRGGKRARKIKEKYATTEVRKQANRTLSSHLRSAFLTSLELMGYTSLLCSSPHTNSHFFAVFF